LIAVTVSAEELWSTVLGSGWEYAGDHWVASRFESGDWDTVGEFRLSGDTTDLSGYDSHLVTKVLTVEDFQAAYEFAVAKGYHHCGSSYAEIDDADACWADGILQIAIYGDIVYG
jgi:hypothetical protein